MIEGLDVMEGTGGFSEPPRYILYEIEEDVGDESDVGIPGNIPNPEVKRVNADGTWRATSWESRKLPTSSFFCFNGVPGAARRRAANVRYLPSVKFGWRRFLRPRAYRNRSTQPYF